MPFVFLLIGTYGTGDAQGIYLCEFNTATGELSKPQQAAVIPTPGFLALSADGQYVYAVGRGEPDMPTAAGRVIALRWEEQQRRLIPLNEEPGGVPTRGKGPSHVSLTPEGRLLMVANYGGGSVESYNLGAAGTLGKRTSFHQHEGNGTNPQRQEGPHAHSITPSPDGKFALAADLGLDKLFVYAVNGATGELTPHEPPFASVAPGSGPRHLAWHTSGKYCYLMNEMSATVTAFTWDADEGKLNEIETVSSMPPGYEGHKQSAEIRVHPTGKFLFASNRGHDSIAVFAIDEATGKLAQLEVVPCGVEWPRNFEIEPTGKFLLVGGKNSDDIAVHRIEESTGQLTLTKHRVEVPSPVCLRFLPR